MPLYKSRLDSSIAQILGTDGDGRRKALIDYISMQPKNVRDAMLLPDDTDGGPADATRKSTLIGLATGWPTSGYQIDPAIMVDGGDPLTVMQQRQTDGFAWVPAYGMDPLPASATGIAKADPTNMPKGAIVVTTDFSTPNDDLVVLNVVDFKYPRTHPEGDNTGVGSTYDMGDKFAELTVTYAGDKKYQKLPVIFDGSGGNAMLLWVRTK